MTFAHLIVQLTAIASLSMDILEEIARDKVNTAGTGVQSLVAACTAAIHMDGEICEPTVPAHIRNNLPVYIAQLATVKQQLIDTATASLDAFAPDAQDRIKNAIARIVDLSSDRLAH